MFTPSKENAARAREILEGHIAKGRASAVETYKSVRENIPTDKLVRGKALKFAPTKERLTISLGDGPGQAIGHHALSQLASRAGIPGQYLAELSTQGGWQRELSAEILNRHYGAGETNTRFLVRAVRDEVRGVMSDHYRRLDSVPLLDAVIEKCKEVGAVPVGGTHTDTRVAFRALIPTVYEPIPGEVVAFGIEWGNSDYANGTHYLRAFLERVWCLNGATMENALSQVHLGGRMSKEFEMSDRTYRLDTQTSVSALSDIINGVLAPTKVKAMCESIRTAAEKSIDWKNLKGSLAKRLLKGELTAAEAAFDSQDVINLPAGKTMWRASNAISWIAGNTEDGDRKLELERLAGELASGRRDVELAAA